MSLSVLLNILNSTYVIESLIALTHMSISEVIRETINLSACYALDLDVTWYIFHEICVISEEKLVWFIVLLSIQL